MARFIKVIFLGIIVLAIDSCRYSGPVDGIITKNVKSKPDSSLLIGTWEVDNMSYDLIKEQYQLKNNKVKLKILKSGDFQVENIPDFIIAGSGKSINSKLSNAYGKWEVDSTDGGWNLLLIYEPGDLFKTKTAIFYQLFLQYGKIVIWESIGDPDEAKRLLYKKIE